MPSVSTTPSNIAVSSILISIMYDPLVIIYCQVSQGCSFDNFLNYSTLLLLKVR
jgi:hypothetical protein